MPANISRTTRIALSVGQFVLVGVLAIAAVAIAAIVVLHQVDPARFGLWWGPGAFFFGSADATMHVRQAHEDTFYLAALIVAALCALVARELFSAARAGLAKNAR